MTDAIAPIRASVIDGIAITPRYRERQLASLHKALVETRSELIQALVEDSKSTVNEATAQFLMVMRSIKIYHNSVDPKRSIEQEYQVAKGQNNAARRSPYGLAAIIPSLADSFYSTTVSVAAAIAAGNCVIVELPQNLSSLNSVLRKVLRKALSSETFAIVDDISANEAFTTQYGVKLNGSEVSGTMSTPRSLTTQANRVVAIVDRSANIISAAAECVKARFAFGGRSAYAPDIILVNEFALQSFRAALAENASRYFSNNTVAPEKKTSQFKERRAGLGAEMQKRLEDSAAEIVVSGNRGTIAVLNDRKSELLSGKLNSALLLIVPISSMDDAINLVGDTSAGEILRATYLFCAPTAAKYLGQFINSALTCTNIIPVELLIGPPAPNGHGTSIQPRYTVDMFSFASPELIEETSLSKTLVHLTSLNADAKQLQTVEQEADIVLERVAEPFGPPIGFFEQGILFGLSCVLITAITAGGFAVRYGYPALISRIRGA